MSRATVTTNKGVFYRWLIFCPGCECAHAMDTRWTFNGDFERPTFTPSISIKGDDKSPTCHSHVRDGRIQFLADSTHALAGQTVDLPDEFNVDFETPVADEPTS